MIEVDCPGEIWEEKDRKNRQSKWDNSKWEHGHCVGAKLITFQILPDKDDPLEEPYNADEEILMEFDNGKEMRIYIDEFGHLHVYTD